MWAGDDEQIWGQLESERLHAAAARGREDERRGRRGFYVLLQITNGIHMKMFAESQVKIRNISQLCVFLILDDVSFY